ncbi:MAG: sodium:proton antiporter [Bacteroidetes bacterium HGW-Bacteroidetes-9]|jgi:Kef-type K+ transport system membrane component KefB|nr:MAG: sodium:proton antiporter [Bacteroidetes bacterium HGW-Bacteroidetes-9]
MSITIIITFCILLLLAYLFDLSSSKTRIPSVILLMLLGYVIRQITLSLNIDLPDFSDFLPTLGTIGLILIVLEGSLELDLNKSKIGLIQKSFFGSMFSIVGLSFLLAFIFLYFGQYSLRDSLINAIPFVIISSAVAIPSAKNLSANHKEFIIYESSFSDILGVLFFNFIAVNEVFNLASFGHFGFQILIIIAISFVATIGLLFLLHKIEHHIKFVPIILLVTLIYAISELFHLPALIIVLVFGLFIGNIDELRRFKFLDRFHPEELRAEIVKFKELTIEATFMVRSVFFLLFGYLIDTSQILNTRSLVWSLAIIYVIYIFRVIQLSLSKLPLKPLLFVAPRGLITILLFLSISQSQRISTVNESLVTQIIILTSIFMMIGIMGADKKEVKAPTLKSEN